MHTADMEAVPRGTCATSVDVHRMEHVDIDNDNQSWFHSAPAVQVRFGHKDKTPIVNVNTVFLVQMGTLPPQMYSSSTMDMGPCDPSYRTYDYRKSASSHKADRTRAIPLPLLQSQSNARPRPPFEFFSLFQTRAKQAGSKPAYIRACRMHGGPYKADRTTIPSHHPQ